MVNSQKCFWQIVLLLEQFGFSAVPLADALLNAEQSLLG